MSEKEELREEGMSLANPFSLSFKDYIFQKMRAVAGAAGKAQRPPGRARQERSGDCPLCRAGTGCRGDQ